MVTCLGLITTDYVLQFLCIQIVSEIHKSYELQLRMNSQPEFKTSVNFLPRKFLPWSAFPSMTTFKNV